MKDTLDAFGRLLTIMDDLREKCPWDKKQTLESLRHLTIEEVYELADAIMEKDMKGIRGELGDLLLHIVFYAKIGSEQKAFDIKDVLDAISEKLIQRHPHIYGDVEVQDEEDVKRNWERLKLKEGKKSVLEGVPGSLPALVKASRIQDKAKGVGFDWNHKEEVWEKVREELEEFRHEVETNPEHPAVEEEFGDVLFSLINYARFVGVNPEDALEKTNRKFIRRFQAMEDKVRTQQKKLEDMTLQEMDLIWNEVK
ncbi:MAG: nucleoside triphosphate pyrophosphohydrolase [Flavobacteriales bacterium]|nr:nucleoside triphosphate pyrophosphohydrolase [Flavobacteriales bacterium]